jgi:hypothetical protein
MDSCDWKPFFKAVFERNPVSIEHFRDKEMQLIFETMQSWPNESIYDGNRLALPDEVVNFQRGDGIEKAITLMNIARSRHLEVTFRQNQDVIQVNAGHDSFNFISEKNLTIPQW